MIDCLSWRIALGSGTAGPRANIPEAIVTLAPGFRHESMPSEVALLLPNTEGPKRLVDAVAHDPALCRNAMLGLFLASPFLNLTLEGERLTRAGVRWITNLPSVEQQDQEFSQQLADVGLDRDRELACLAELRSQGFRIAAVVAAFGFLRVSGLTLRELVVFRSDDWAPLARLLGLASPP